MVSSKQSPPAAEKVIMDLLARRDHSEKELREKLMRRKFADEQIEQALAYAHERRWLGDSTRLAQTLADNLHRRGKGIKSINHELSRKGLPQVSIDKDLEYEKAFAQAQRKQKTKKFADLKDPKVRAGLARFLQTRGFSTEIIRKVLQELRVAT